MAQFFSSLFSLPQPVYGVLHSIGVVWGYVWWIVLPVVTGAILWEFWIAYLHYEFIHNMHFVLLELKVPKNVLKTPKSMEQIFASAHAPYSYGYRFSDKYIKGLEEYWMSFELIGKAGETHFYLRVPRSFRNMMESAIYAQFPDAELREVPDYLDDMPEILPNATYDVSGFEEVLRRESYRPIRTYEMFEDSVEERRLDPIAMLIEANSRLRGEEQLWMQLIVRPTGEHFKDEGEKAINKILHIEEEHKKKASLWPEGGLGLTLGEIISAPFVHPGEAKHKEDHKSEKQQRFIVPPHQKELAELIQKKITKLAFDTTIRFLYIDRKGPGPKPEHLNSVHGFIRQFNTNDVNQLKPEKETTTAGYAVRGLFKKQRLHYRKRMIYEHYRHTQPGHGHGNVLNIEELATIFHFPSNVVSTTELEKVESKKGTPPASLPTFEE